MNQQPESKLTVISQTCLSLKEVQDKGVAHPLFFFALFIEPLSRWIRQNSDVKGITMTSGEQKMSLFADDLSLYLTHPTQTIPKLMKILQDYGLVSGYKINGSKTQVLSFHYNPPPEIRNISANGIGTQNV